jgi:hypothetical protein
MRRGGCPRAGKAASGAGQPVLVISAGRGIAGDTTGNSPGTKWVAFNALAKHLDVRAALHGQDQPAEPRGETVCR